LAFILERYGQAGTEKMMDLLVGMKRATDKARGIGKLLSVWQIEEYEQRYEEILRSGFRKNPLRRRTEEAKGKRGRVGQTKPRNLLGRMREHKSAILLFLKDLRVPFENNQAERDIRIDESQAEDLGRISFPGGRQSVLPDSGIHFHGTKEWPTRCRSLASGICRNALPAQLPNPSSGHLRRPFPL
jgi:transposase